MAWGSWITSAGSPSWRQTGYCTGSNLALQDASFGNKQSRLSPYPAFSFAAVPVRTKTPAPMMPPRPRKIRSTVVRVLGRSRLLPDEAFHASKRFGLNAFARSLSTVWARNELSRSIVLTVNRVGSQVSATAVPGPPSSNFIAQDATGAGIHYHWQTQKEPAKRSVSASRVAIQD